MTQAAEFSPKLAFFILAFLFVFLFLNYLFGKGDE